MTMLCLTLLIVIGAANLLASVGSIIVGRATKLPETPIDLLTLPSAVSDEVPFVSVHVAIHDEPANLVMATLDALSRSDYPAFEVIVIDNNTPDARTWRPVERHVTLLGGRFRFYHFEGVEGAKAGALNLALERVHPRTAYVGVVDADYQVASDFIGAAVAACGPTVQFVQFPQAYRQARGASAVVAELSAYFATFPRAANREQASLLTGTLSMISIAALRDVGGWPTGSITEDAELGLKLWSSGARGLYIDRVAGHGLLPMDLAGLRLQRQRWVTGNVQTLIAGSKGILRMQGGFLAVLAQLTAWVGFLAIPLMTLLVTAAAHALPAIENTAPSWAWQLAEGVSVASFACVLLGHVMRAVVRKRVATLAVTFALLWTSSFAWLNALRGRRARFRRTPKAASNHRGLPSIDTIGSVVALAAATAYFAEGSPLTATVLLLSATGLLTAPVVDRALRRAASGA